MNNNQKTSRVLGIAFLFQFITSFFLSGVFLKPNWLVSGNLSETMLKIADKPWLVRTNMLVDMLTALGVVFLGAMLFIPLRKISEKCALVAMGFYILEAGLLAASRMATFSLLRISEDYVRAGQPDNMLMLGNLALESMDFLGDTLHVLAFCLGAILFYYLLYKSSLVPKALSLWGLITLFPLLAGTVAAVYGYEFPFFLYVPYVPFEFVIGIWILVKGIPEARQQLIG